MGGDGWGGGGGAKAGRVDDAHRRPRPTAAHCEGLAARVVASTVRWGTEGTGNARRFSRVAISTRRRRGTGSLGPRTSTRARGDQGRRPCALVAHLACAGVAPTFHSSPPARCDRWTNIVSPASHRAGVGAARWRRGRRDAVLDVLFRRRGQRDATVPPSADAASQAESSRSHAVDCRPEVVRRASRRRAGPSAAGRRHVRPARPAAGRHRV